MRSTTMATALALMAAASMPLQAHELPEPAPSARPAPAAPAALDPAVQRAMMSLTTTMLAGFAAGLTAGASGQFDAEPLIEKTLRQALAGRDFNNAIDSALAQAFAGGNEGASALPPEMRALLATTIKAVLAMARNEMLREASAGANNQ